MGLIEGVGEGPVALDAATVIYYVEEHPAYIATLDPLFDAAERGEVELVTSAITLLEVLVVPYRAGAARISPGIGRQPPEVAPGEGCESCKDGLASAAVRLQDAARQPAAIALTSGRD